jgi:hypothetical protein
MHEDIYGQLVQNTRSHLNKRAHQDTWHNCSDMRARIHVALLLQQPIGGCTGCTKRWQGAEAPEAAVIRVHDYVLKCARHRHQSCHCTGCSGIEAPQTQGPSSNYFWWPAGHSASRSVSQSPRAAQEGHMCLSRPSV